MATHLAVITMLITKPIRERFQAIRWSVLGFASLAAAGAAIYFIGLQVFWIEHLCPYGLVAHAAGVTLAAAFWLTRPAHGLPMRWMGTTAAVALAILIGLQTLNEAPSSVEIIEHENANVTERSTFASPPSDAGKDEVLFEAPERQVSRSHQ